MVNIKYHNNNSSINSDGSSLKIQRLITSSSQETKATEETTLASVNSDEKQRLTPTQITIEDDGDKDSIPLADEPKSYRDWFKYYGPSNNDEKHKQLQYNSHRRDRLIVTIILVGALLTLVIFIAFMYERVQRKSDQNQREVNYLSNKLDIINRELQQLEAGTSPEARARKTGALKNSDLIKKV